MEEEHLAAMDHLRQGIHLRGYARRSQETGYKRESFDLFTRCWKPSSATWSAS